MTGRHADGTRCSALTRRRLLAATAAGITGGLAGCGYRPGGGDLAWESSISSGGLFGSGSRWWIPTSDRLVTVRNQSGRTYDFEADEWRDVENAAVTAIDGTGTTRLEAETERQAVGRPAVTADSVVVPVEGGRVTAIDRDAAAIDADDRGAAPGEDEPGTDAESDEIRWQVDAIPSGGDDSEPSIAVRASGRLAVAVARNGFVALDAATGDRAFALSDAWPAGTGDPDRVAVDGEDVWVAGLAVEDGEGDDGSGDTSSAIGRFGPAGDRRAERSIADGRDWLAVVDGVGLAGNTARETLTGYGRDLDRQFALEVPPPTSRPPVVDDTDGGRVYLRRGGTIRAVDIDGGGDGSEAGVGEVAWERSDVPAHRALAVDEDGIYAVGDRGQEPVVIAVGADGADRWTAPLPEDVRVEELFAVDDRLIVVDDGELYGLHADPGKRWSLLG